MPIRDDQVRRIVHTSTGEPEAFWVGSIEALRVVRPMKMRQGEQVVETVSESYLVKTIRASYLVEWADARPPEPSASLRTVVGGLRETEP